MHDYWTKEDAGSLIRYPNSIVASTIPLNQFGSKHVSMLDHTIESVLRHIEFVDRMQKSLLSDVVLHTE